MNNLESSELLKAGTVLVPKPEWEHCFTNIKHYIVTAENEKAGCTIGERWMIKTEPKN